MFGQVMAPAASAGGVAKTEVAASAAAMALLAAHERSVRERAAREGSRGDRISGQSAVCALCAMSFVVPRAIRRADRRAGHETSVAE